jgi:PST family polysaccharide transporter
MQRVRFRPLAVETGSLLTTAAGNRRLALGAIASGSVGFVKVALQLLLLPFMARLLGPTEFGLYALALPTVSLVGLLADGGLGNTLAREEESAVLIWSSAFWALLVIGITLALAVASLGMLLGYFTQQPRLSGMIALLSLSLVFLSLSVLPSARLLRRKHLGIGAGVELVSAVISAVIAVSLAWYGAGAWSLAVQYVSSFAIRAILLNLSAFRLPELAFDLRALQPHLVSGGLMVGSRIADTSGRVAETFFIDRIFGTTLLGNFTFANQVSKFATEAAANVIWSALYVQALSGERASIVTLHRRLCRLLAMVLFPSMGLAAIAAPELVSLFLGDKWANLAFLLRVLLPLYAFYVICCQTSPILLARGRFDISFWCLSGVSAGRVVAVVLGLWIGFAGAVYAIVAVTLVYCAAMLIFSGEATGCRPIPMLVGLIRPAAASAAAVGVYALCFNGHQQGPVWIFLSLAAGFAAYLLLMALIDHKSIRQDWEAIRRTMSPQLS